MKVTANAMLKPIVDVTRSMQVVRQVIRDERATMLINTTASQ
jgi:hypothetical protein